MIASLRGRLLGRGTSTAVVDVGGVGYLIHSCAPTLAALGEMGDEVFVYVQTRVREDSITLYGFISTEEQSVFEMLLGVQGVGPSVALSMLSTIPPLDLLVAIAKDNVFLLTAANGVGSRLATRIIADLREKAAQAMALLKPGLSTEDSFLQVTGPVESNAVRDAREVLVSTFGYSKSQAETYLKATLLGPEPPIDTASIIRSCLQLAHANV